MKVEITSKGTITKCKIDGVEINNIKGINFKAIPLKMPLIFIEVQPDELIIDGDMEEV